MTSIDDQLELLTRGAVELHEAEDLKRRLEAGKPLRVKTGFDPTRPDLHIGHTVLMQKMRQFQEFGHTVIFLVGDFTAMVGDPTGQNEMRPRLTREQVLAAAETYTEQAFRILDRDQTEVRYNSEWLGEMALTEVIALTSRRTVARTMERRDFKERFEQNRDIYLHELLYPMLQGYDSVALDADIELGGTDQLFNLMVGRDLMKAYGKRPQMVLTTPILEGIDARLVDDRIVGKKMSKSADNYIGLTESPVEMTRKCMQIDDAVIWRFFELLSTKTTAEIRALRDADDPIAAKRAFAAELVTTYHSADEAASAWRTFAATYLGEGAPDDTPTIVVPTDGSTLSLAKALSAASMVKSTSEGRRMIVQGGVQVNSERVVDGTHQLARGETYLVRVGSKKRRFCHIRVGE